METRESLLSLPAESFEMLGWMVTPALHRMERGGTVRLLEPKVVEVLAVLAARAGTPITRQELLDTVWADVVVTDDVLTRCISELRKLFGDDARNPHVIETLPRIGYRLLAPVRWLTDPSASGDSLGSLPLPVPVPTTAPAGIKKTGHPVRWMVGAVVGVLVLGLGFWMGSLEHEDSAPVFVSPVALRPLTTDPAQEVHARVSPDGERVAYVSDASGAFNLYLTDFQPGSTPLQLTDDPVPERSPVWSPDGTEIAFIRQHENVCQVLRMPALGGPETLVASCASARYATLDWSPDGSWLVLDDQMPGETGTVLHRLDLETGHLAPFNYDRTGSRGDYYPQVSPDGTRLSFLRSLGEGQTDLFVLHLADGEVERLTTLLQPISAQAWSPDGTAIFFIEVVNGQPMLRRYDVATATTTWVPVLDVGYRLSIGSERMVFEQRTVRMNLYRVEQDEVLTPLAASSATDRLPTFSPDGQRLAFLSNRSGSYQVWVRRAEGGLPQPLTALNGVVFSPPHWSPDGQRLVLTTFEEGQAEVYVVDAFGDKPRLLTDHPSNEVYPSFSADGRWVYFGSDRTGSMEIWKQPVGGGEARQVTTQGGLMALEAPDGTALYYTKEGVPGVWKKEDAAQEQLVQPAVDLSMLGRWWPSPEGLVALVEQPFERTTHHLIVTNARKTDTLRVLHDLRVGSGSAFHPATQQLVVPRIDHYEADLQWMPVPH